MGAGTPDGIDVLGLGALVFSISGSLEPFNCQYKRDINFLILHFNSFSTKNRKVQTEQYHSDEFKEQRRQQVSVPDKGNYCSYCLGKKFVHWVSGHEKSLS